MTLLVYGVNFTFTPGHGAWPQELKIYHESVWTKLSFISKQMQNHPTSLLIRKHNYYSRLIGRCLKVKPLFHMHSYFFPLRHQSGSKQMWIGHPYGAALPLCSFQQRFSRIGSFKYDNKSQSIKIMHHIHNNIKFYRGKAFRNIFCQKKKTATSILLSVYEISTVKLTDSL